MMLRLRVHHLLCSALFVGKGYSEGFCENMQKIVQWLWEKSPQGEEREVELIFGEDSICKECPNLTKEGCSLGDNHVVSKDVRLAQALQLQTDRSYSVSALLGHVEQNLTEEIFETSCHKCEWYRMGLCSYAKLADKYSNYSGI